MRTSNKNGISTLAALMVLVLLGMMGLLIAYLSALGREAGALHLLSTQAFYVTQAGIEYAVKKIYDGSTPVVTEPGNTFGPGHFTVSWANRTVTVTGRVGTLAQRVHSVTSPTQADCTRLDVGSVQMTGDDTTLSGIQLRKICLPQVVLDKAIFSWVPDDNERLTRIKIENTTVYSNPGGAVSGSLLELADYVMSGVNVHNMNKVDFNREMEGKTFTLILTFGDQSSTTVTFSPGR